jgi:uncharacterized protein YceH (UPF0502 family)
MSGDIDGATAPGEPMAASAPAAAPQAGLAGRVQDLEAQVESLQRELAEIRRLMERRD